MRIGRLVAPVLTAFAVLAVGALPASAATTSEASASSVDLKGTYVLSGALSKHGSFVDPELVRSSCAQIGKDGTGTQFVGGPNAFAVPSPLPPTGGAENVYFTVSVKYKGPGSYSKEDLLKGGGTSLTVGKHSYNAVAGEASASLRVEADGAGTFSFAKAPPVGAGPSLSGKVTWTCSA